MKGLLLVILAVTTNYFPQLTQSIFNRQQPIFEHIKTLTENTSALTQRAVELQALNSIQLMLRNEAPNMNQLVIDKVVTTLKCSNEYHVNHNNILTVIDYSLPSNEKRLWVFNLVEKKLLFY